MSSIMRRSELARFETIIKFSRCCRESSVSSVTPVSPMILSRRHRQLSTIKSEGKESTNPFIGVRISCDILARNSDLLRFASSAASRAIVFFCKLSRNEKTILLIFVLSESISPDASTVTNELKSPSVAAAEIWAKARTCEVKFVA